MNQLLVLNDFIQSNTVNWFNPIGLLRMLSGFTLNFLVVWFICHFFYYPKSRRRDYFFTYIFLSVAIYMMIYLMDGSNFEIGAALGLFAVFGILRYRTESIPIREMTYLFFVVALSVINGLESNISIVEKAIANILFVTVAWGVEKYLLYRKEGCKFVKYDKIELITPERRPELIADLEKRLGIKVNNVEIGAVDFLKDMCMLHVYYDDDSNKLKEVDHVLKIKEENAFE